MHSMAAGLMAIGGTCALRDLLTGLIVVVRSCLLFPLRMLGAAHTVVIVNVTYAARLLITLHIRVFLRIGEGGRVHLKGELGLPIDAIILVLCVDIIVSRCTSLTVGSFSGHVMVLHCGMSSACQCHGCCRYAFGGRSSVVDDTFE